MQTGTEPWSSGSPAIRDIYICARKYPGISFKIAVHFRVEHGFLESLWEARQNSDFGKKNRICVLE